MNINKETGLYEEYGFIYEPFWHKLSFIIPTLIIISSILIILFYFLYQYYQKRKIARMTPAERAIFMLEKLNRDKQKDLKLFTEDILIILKMYGEKKYQENIVHYTPQECAIFFCNKLKQEDQKTSIRKLFLEIESILFSHEYRDQDFFIKAPREIFPLIETLEKKR